MNVGASADRIYVELRGKTAPLLLLEHAARKPYAIAYRAKKKGIYQERTWHQFNHSVASAAMGLRELGLCPGERVAIMGDPCEEWVLFDMATQALGGISYGIYPTSSRSEVEYMMRDGGASIFVAQDQEYVDKILPLLDTLPQVKWVVVIDTTAIFAYRHPKLISCAAVLEKGRHLIERAPEAYAEQVKSLDPGGPAFIIYTSGTTGAPKGAVMSHGKHLAAAYTMIEHSRILQSQPHRTVAYLPLCHIFGRNVVITLPLLTDLVPHYGENIEDLPRTIFEVGPTVLFTVPRYLQKFAAQVLTGIENSSRLKKIVYRLAFAYGRRYAMQRWGGRKAMFSHLVYGVCRQLAFLPILNKIGFDRLRVVLTGGAAIPEQTMAFWQIYGVNVVELYGQTEAGGGIIAGQDDYFPRPGDVGRPPSPCKIKLGKDNEILVFSPHLFEGYWKNRDKTRETISDDGWLATGDIGAWTENGSLKIVDRCKDIIITDGGKNISPTYVENILRSSAYISDAIVFGNNRKYLTALVEIEFDSVADWARRANIVYTGFTSLIQHPKVQELVQDEISRSNIELSQVEQVKAFRLLPVELDPEVEGEPVTPTRKIKRDMMYRKFQHLVDSMYDHTERERLSAQIGDLFAQSAAAP